MDTLKDKSLLEWAFGWNQTRLVVAGATLLLAKQTPILTYLMIPVVSELANRLMTAAWIISGVAAGYLIHLWLKNDKKVFGGSEKVDNIAFGIAVVTGINLGIAGLLSINIGFRITPYEIMTPVMMIAGLAYFWSAFHLHKRGGANKLFVTPSATPDPVKLVTEQPTDQNNNNGL